MIIIKRDRVTFYISDDSVVVSNGDFQHSSYNTFSMANKSNFYKFKSTILDSTYPAFSKIIDVVELSSQCQVYGYSTRKPNLEGVKCEYRE